MQMKWRWERQYIYIYIFFFFWGGGAHSQAHSIIIESHIFPQLNDFYITCLRKHSVVSASGFFTVIFDLWTFRFPNPLERWTGSWSPPFWPPRSPTWSSSCSTLKTIFVLLGIWIDIFYYFSAILLWNKQFFVFSCPNNTDDIKTVSTATFRPYH